MTKILGISTLALLALSATAAAHAGPRIWLNVEGDNIIFYDGPATVPSPFPSSIPPAYAPQHIFTQLWYDADLPATGITGFPGFQKVPGGTITSPTTFSIHAAGPALWFNPETLSTPAFFDPLANHFPQLTILVENGASDLRNAGPGTSLSPDFTNPLALLNYVGNTDHGHLHYTLLGDGTTLGGPAGVYALPMKVTAGSLSSDTFYLLLGNPQDATAPSLAAINTQLAAAKSLLAAAPVPEPGTLAIAGAAAATILTRRKRK